MVTFEAIKEFGENLRKSDTTLITIERLYSLLRTATNSHRTETLKRYVQLLKQEGYISYKGHGWEVIR